MVPFELSDKFLHFIAFVGGGVLLVTALRLSTRWQPARIIWIGFAALALYGAADEWHQLSTPNRSGADPLDWLADVLGAAAGVSATALLRIRRPPATA